MLNHISAFRASILHFLSDPGKEQNPRAIQYFEDGLLIVNNGRVEKIGPAVELMVQLGDDVLIIDHSGKLIMPGFVDTHVHYVQTDIIASYGEQLLQWLEKYTFPAERKFEDPAHAREVANFFLEELLRNGTTSAMILGSVHKTLPTLFLPLDNQEACV